MSESALLVEMLREGLLKIITELPKYKNNVEFLTKVREATKLEVTWRDSRRCSVKLTYRGMVHTLYIADVVPKTGRRIRHPEIVQKY